MARVTVAASSRLSADAGAVAASNGGNAVDAAIAASIASMCTDPGIISLGGGGFITIWPPDSEPVVIDCYAEMPGRSATAERFGGGATEVYMEYGGGMTTIVGHGSVATPGAIRGFGVAQERYGAIDWSGVIGPTLPWAEEGFPLSGAAAEYFTYSHDVIYGWHPESYEALHHPDGSYLKEGEILRLPGLRASLETLAAEGPEVFYTGELGRRLSEDNLANGGLVGLDDLAAYEAVTRDPIRFRIGDWELATNPPPALGGVTAVAILMLLDDVESWSHEDVMRMVAAQDAVFGYRRSRLSVGPDLAPQLQELLDLAKLGDYRKLLSSPSTIHVSATDATGIACSISMSSGYGSGAVLPGTGIWLNNSLGEVELHPEGFHSVPPGSRLISNMAPTVARSSQGAALAIGTPGASRITSAVSLTILNLLRFGMPLAEAVNHSRLHVEIFEDNPTVAFEPDIDIGEPPGFQLRPFPANSMYFGGVQAAMWDPVAGLSGVADARRNGAVAVAG